MKFILKSVALTAAAAAVSLTSLHGADWSGWRGPAGDGTSPESVAVESWSTDGPKVAWKTKVGIGFAAAAIAGGNLYTLGNVGGSDTATLWCLDAVSGRKLWAREFPSPLAPTMYEGGPNAAPVVDGGRLYAVIKPTRVLCLNASTGETIWDTDPALELKAQISPWGIVGAPLVSGDQVVLNYGSNGTALDKATGKVRWSTGAKGASYNHPVPARFGAEPSVVVFATNAVVGLRLKDGAELFRHTFGSGYFCHSADPIVRGDEVFISSADEGGELLRVNPGEKPTSRWKHKDYGNFLATSILKDGYLYGFNNCGTKSGAELKCVEWSTGKVRWSEKGFGDQPGSPVLAGKNQLITLSDKGEITVGRISPERFELVTRFQGIGGKTWTGPVLANGRLYVRNGAGELVCFDVGPAKSI